MLLSSPMALDIKLRSPQDFLSKLSSPPQQTSMDAVVGSPKSGIMTSCRALQSFLQTSLPTPIPTPTISSAPTNLLQSPIDLSKPRRKEKSKHKVYKTQPVQRKRRRTHSDSLWDQENSFDYKPSTPKRARTAFPPSLPLGLSRADFLGLKMASPGQSAWMTSASNESSDAPRTPENFNRLPDTNFFSPSGSLPFALPPPAMPAADVAMTDNDGEHWSHEDDNALVQLILKKFKLKQSDWDDCAAELSKSKNSIGERWRRLVGEGDVGLRRGVGKRGRRSLEDLIGEDDDYLFG